MKTPGPSIPGAGGSRAGSATAFAITSPSIPEGAPIPVRFTCDGDDLSPPLAWHDPPEGTQAFALIVHDPDAPAGDWIHWVLYDVPAGCRELPEGVPARERVEGIGTQGVNDFRRLGWGGPCPPRGSSHRYHFRLLALDREVRLGPDLKAQALLAAIKGHVLAETELVTRYQRPPAR